MTTTINYATMGKNSYRDNIKHQGLGPRSCTPDALQ